MPTDAHSTRRDDIAYIAPMAAFLLLTWAGGRWPGFFVASYVLKTFLTAALLIWFRRSYTRIPWQWSMLAVALGIIGLVQWVGVEELLLKCWKNYPKIPGATEPFQPFDYFTTPARAWSFIIIRWAGATLVVPFMEELFWRDYLWRTMAAPNDFKLAGVGEWDLKAFLVVTLLFTSVHPQWITALIWGAGIGGLLVWKRSLGACIIMHAATNFLLGAYTLYTGKWYYW
ncbi:MAG: CAAX prenyl protease-related protein [Tepidisphaerales bacterium]